MHPGIWAFGAWKPALYPMIKTHSDRATAGRTEPDVRDARRTSTHRAPNRPQGTEKRRGLTAIPAGQTPGDLVRPKGFEPLTF